MSGDDFTRGFITGFAVAGLVGLLAQQLLLGRLRGIAAFFKPQTTLQETGKSPFQVYWGCTMNIILLAILVIVGIWFVREYYGSILGALHLG